MKIALVSSEVVPFARTGGLGDVLGALPREIAKLGHEVTVVMPNYGSLSPDSRRLAEVDWTASIDLGEDRFQATARRWRDQRAKVDYYFIGNEHLFERPELYRDQKTGKDYTDNAERFAFFGKAALELFKATHFAPDIIHVHDWQAALIPAFLKTSFVTDPAFTSTKTVLTIHNLGYQGVFDADKFPLLGLPEEYNYAMTGPLEFYRKINFLKAGIVLADAVSTVSPTYAKEIQSGEEFGCGLEGVLSRKEGGVSGILNGVDYAIWSPSRDKKIPFRFGLSNLSGKRMCRTELLNRAGLPIREDCPVVGMISRLADQKGWDILTEAADEIFSMNVQFVVLGTGDELYHKKLTELQALYPDKLRVYLAFDDEVAHQIEAGADIFLMPSKYEPCGLNQMYSLKYGTVPVVRRVGGLADSVEDYDYDTQSGTGFVFEEYTPSALVEALDRAVSLFPQRRRWSQLMKTGMQKDFSWQASAQKYVELFSRVRSS